ncbi:hypothetical protein NFJ02_40g106110 [Pycnococcus provasolii]
MEFCSGGSVLALMRREGRPLGTQHDGEALVAYVASATVMRTCIRTGSYISRPEVRKHSVDSRRRREACGLWNSGIHVLNCTRSRYLRWNAPLDGSRDGAGECLRQRG